MNIEILSDVPVSPNLAANDARAAACPSMCRLQNGDVVLNYRIGQTKHSLDGVLCSQRSRDGGASWSELVVIYDGTRKAAPESVHSGALCQSDDGTVYVIFTVTEVKNPHAFIYSEEGRSQRQSISSPSPKARIMAQAGAQRESTPLQTRRA
jgi:hypothetical protein